MRTISKTLRLFTSLCGLMVLVALSSQRVDARDFSRVIIDPGHGGKDKGAIWYGVRESNLNMKVATKVETLLKAHRIPVTLTRRSDVFVSLEKRAQIANRYKNAIFVSIHFNAVAKHHQVHGLETYYTSSEGKKLARQIHKNMLSKLNIRDRRLREANFKVLKATRCPAVLIECGYLSNYHERTKSKRSWYHSLCASAIVDGILAYKKY